MNNPSRNLKALALAAMAAGALHSSAVAQGTAFTYQGRLDVGGAPATGVYDFQFNLYGVGSSGVPVFGGITHNGQTVSNGLFTVTLDFLNSFPGADRWLEISVKTNGAPAFDTLTPRQKLTATPYAITAGNVTGAVPASQLSGTIAAARLPGSVVTNNASGLNLAGSFTGNGAGLSNVNAATLNGLTGANFWQTNGNLNANPTNGAFVGTRDNLPLEAKVNGSRALRLEPNPNSPNVISGHAANRVTPGAFGAAIGGGGDAFYPNSVGASYATVVGGGGNVASGLYSVAGGAGNSANSPGSVALGRYNVTGGEYSMALGNSNTASAVNSTALGYGTRASGGSSTAMGDSTWASGLSATALGERSVASGNYSAALNYGTHALGTHSTALGWGSEAGGNFSVASGYGGKTAGERTFAAGTRAHATNEGSFVWSDASQGIDTNAAFGTTGTNQFLIRARGGVGINTNRPQEALHVAGKFLRVDGNAEERAYIGGDGFGGDVQVGSLNPGINTVALYNAATASYMNLFANNLNLTGTLTGNGSGLTDLPAGQLSGSIADARLSANVALRAGGNSFTGNQTISGANNLEFGAGVAGKEFNAGKIGYGTFTPNTLDIVGAAQFGFGRRIKLWAEGGTEFSGAVGIGTDTPDKPLSIVGFGAASEWLSFKSADGVSRWHLNNRNNGLNFAQTGIADARLFLGVNGNVGVGTDNPVNGRLHVLAGASGDAIHATCNSASTAVYANNTSGSGFGVTGVAAGSGTAVLGSNPNPAGHAGYFDGNVRVTGTTTTGVLTTTGGADLAEPFKMSDKDLPKGAVVVIDEENPGHLKLSEGAYDTRVAGIISGAGGVNPGISLSQHGVMEGDQNVALSGRVYVQADASTDAIKPGDLLTTSTVPGHAMKVSDATRSQGAILGKAMTSLKDGKGLVLVLVTLQ